MAENAKEGGQKSAGPSALEQAIAKAIAPLADAVSGLVARDAARSEADAKAAATKAATDAAAKQAEDTDIRNILKQAGEEEAGADNLDRLSNKQLVEVLSGAVEAALAAHSTQLKTELANAAGGSKTEIEGLQKAVMSIVAGLSVRETRAKFPDFDKYKDGVADVVKQYPGIGFEDAYLIAKSRMAGKVAPKDQTESEKPASFGTPTVGPVGGMMPGGNDMETIAERGRASRGAEPTKSGVTGFRALVDAGAEKVLSSNE